MKSEQDPLDPRLCGRRARPWPAIRQLEEAVLGAEWTEGIVLRYGVFYGPGTSLAPGEEQFELVVGTTASLRGAGTSGIRDDV